MKEFRFWCQKVLPLVYDDSLSYYEVLCKVVNYINELIKSDNQIIQNVSELQEELETVQSWIDNFKYDEIDKLLAEYIPTSVMFGISDSGFFTVYIPGPWSNITFRTTGYDYITPMQPDFGHLVLLY